MEYSSRESVPDRPGNKVASAVCRGEYPNLKPINKTYGSETYRHLWALTLGVAGLLDILATVLPTLVGKIGACDDASSYDVCERHISAAATFPHEFLEFVDWMDENNLAISLFFSTLWFIDAFFKAHRARHRVLRKKERQRLRFHQAKERTRKWFDSSTFVYYRAITVQLLFLPVGFYFIVYDGARQMMNGQDMEEIEAVVSKKIVFLKSIDNTGYKSFSVKSKEAFLIALAEYIIYSAFGVTSREAKSIFKRHKTIQTRKLIRNAIRHPRVFRRKLTKLLAWVRYVRYTIPLIGGVNKLRANIKEMNQRRRQRREAKTVKRIRQLLWGRKTSEVLTMAEAATTVQCAYRFHRSQKARHALKLLRADREYIAVAKIQHILRRKAREARLRLKQKKEELERLAKLDQERLDEAEKLRFYELQDELVNETKKLIDRKMLIRPNRGFVFYWKLLFIICIAFEICQKVAISWFEIRIQNRKKGDIALYVVENIVPLRVAELPQCMVVQNKEDAKPRSSFNSTGIKDALFDRPSYCEEPYATYHDLMRDVLALLVTPKPVSEWAECKPAKWYQLFNRVKKPVPWYCNERFYSGHAFYRLIASFMWEEFLVLVGIICFMDVFVTFFTGEFHPDNGTLIPKPFFKRWIIPGLVFQLLVNPQLGNVASWAFKTGDKILENGPARVYRWSAAVAFPLIYLCAYDIGVPLWTRFATYANQNSSPFASKPTSAVWLTNDAS
eukprot:scaffold1194_cov127-Cylindrotheca_fusiformis.AAC.16